MGWLKETFGDNTPLTTKRIAEKFHETHGQYVGNTHFFLVSTDRMMVGVTRVDYVKFAVGSEVQAQWKEPY